MVLPASEKLSHHGTIIYFSRGYEGRKTNSTIIYFQIKGRGKEDKQYKKGINPIGKKQCPTLTRDKAKIEYISGGETLSPSPYGLAFGVGLGSNPHSKMVSEPILYPLTGHSPYYSRTKPKSVVSEGEY